MLFWIIFLIFIYLFFAKFRFNGKLKDRRSEILGIFFIIIISAIRFDVGWDYGNYYSTIYPYVNQEALEKTEPLSQIIILSSDFTGYPPSLFILYSILTYGIAGYCILKHSANVYVSILVYLVFFYLNSLSVVRQGLAVSIVLCSLTFLIDKKLLQFAFCVVISYLIHSSSAICLIFIPIYLLTSKKSFFIIFTIALASLFSARFFVERLFPGYLSYVLNADEYSGGNAMKILMLVIVGLVSVVSYKRNNLNMIRLSCISAIGVLFPFFLGGHIGGRIAMYFYIPLIYLLPEITNSIKKYNIKNFLIITLNFLFIFTIFTDCRNPIKSSLTPYKTIFTENIYNPKFKN